MSSTLTVTDQIVPTLLKLQENGRGFALQAMNKGGAKSRIQLERDSDSAGFHDIHQRISNGGRLLARGKKRLFSRFDKNTGMELPSMGKLSKWKLHPLSGVLLVGFINTKRFKTYSYNGGKLTNVGISPGALTKSIADKIINGKREKATTRQMRFFRASGLGASNTFDYEAHSNILNFGKYTSILNKEIDRAFNEALSQAKIA